MAGTPIVKVNAGFMGPGQTAKSYVGKLATSATEAKKQAIETVTGKTTKEIGTITGTFTNGSPTVTGVTAASFANLPEGWIELETTTGIAKGTTVKRLTPEQILANINTAAGTDTGAGGSWAEQVRKKEFTMSSNFTGTTGEKTIKVYALKSLGKTYYITDIFLCTNSESNKGAEVSLKVGSTTIFTAQVHSLAPIDLTGIETQFFAVEGEAVELEVAITAKNTEGGALQPTVWFNIQGFEQ